MTSFRNCLVFLSFLFFLFLYGEEKFSRVRIYYQNCHQLEELLKFPGLDVLRTEPGQYLDAVVELAKIKKISEAGFKAEIVVEDLAQHFKNLLAGSKGGVFGNYYTYGEIRQSIVALQSRFPGLVKVDSLPTRSIQNRAIYLVKVSNSPNSNNGRPEIIISGAMHAYEPIGPSLCMSDMTYLCEHYATDPEIRWLVDNRQIFFIPVMNPDGYVYNETYPGRSWRKNRRLNPDSSYGVDLNRNYPYKWGYDNRGSSPIPSAWNYRGTAPASEPETRAILDFVNSHRIRTWHNHHSPNDVLLIPFGYIDSYPWNDTLEYYTMCREESLLYGFRKWGNSFRAYGYLVNGGTEDWAWCDSSTYKIFCLIPELGMDYWEGLTDSSKIVNVCMRMLNAELYLIQVAGFFPKVLSVSVNDSPPGGNNDGILNPGERANLRIGINNKAVVDTGFGLIGYLSTSYPHLTINDSTGNYGDVIRLSRAVNSDPFAVACSTSANPGDWVNFNLRMAWNSNNYQKMLTCSLRIGPYIGVEEDRRWQIRDGSLKILILQNPTFSKNLRIRYSLHKTMDVKLILYNSLGQVVEILVDGMNGGGVYEKILTKKLRSGIYFVRLTTDNKVTTKKIVIFE